MGTVALFSTDRSLTGQDGIGFTPGAIDSEEPPAELARRLIAADDGIDHVYVLSNTVTVRRGTDWDEDSVADAAEVISGLFVHYPPADSFVSGEEDEALRSQHYNATLSEIRAHNEDLWVMMVRPRRAGRPLPAGPVHHAGIGLLGATLR